MFLSSRFLAILVLVSLALMHPGQNKARAASQVLKADTITTVGGYKDAADTIQPISVTGAPFTKALRISRAKPGENSYSAAMTWQTTAPVRKGDLIVATFYIRNLQPQAGALAVEATFQLSDTPYTWTLTAMAPSDSSSWKKYAIPVRANQDYPAGKSSLQIRYGLIAQKFEIGGVAVINHGKVADPIPPAIAGTFAYYYPGRGDPKADWRKAALARIETIRKGTMKVRVVNAQGKPVKGAAVKLTQTASPFVWGTAASAISLTCKVDPGDNTRSCPTTDQLGEKPVTTSDYRKLRQNLLKDFNGASFYNDLKWTEWYYQRQLALDGIAWLKRNKMPITRAHNLIWPNFEPDFLMPRDLINRSTPAAQVKRIVEQRMAEQPGALKGQIPEWDVVNEPFTNYDVQGRIASTGLSAEKGVLPTAVVADWFKIARKADPKALLFLNDFGILENLNPTHQRYDLALLKYIKSLGAPVDGIGFQGHFGESGPMFKDMQRVINDFAPHVKVMSITEFDYTTVDPALQRDLMEDFMTFIYSQPKFNQFQMWGFWDGDHWLGSAPVYYRNWTLKPSGVVWQKLTKKTWRTDFSGTTGSTGELSLRAFYGKYSATVTVGGKTCKATPQFTSSGQVVTLKAVC
jgi:endo-1,4-beta-xylanase